MAEASRGRKVLIFLSFLLVDQVICQCGDGLFGGDCQYNCHCSSSGSCDQDTGHCPYGCSKGWSGPSCQTQNVALQSRDVSQSSTYCDHSSGQCFNASFATDGKTNQSCARTGNSSYNEWKVTLDKAHYIHRLRIYNGQDCCGESLDGFYVSVGDMKCYEDRRSSSPGSQGSIIDVTCSHALEVSSVTVVLSTSQDRMLTLCEVEIFVCAPGWYGSECNISCNGTGCAKCNGTGTTCEDCQVGMYGENCEKECHCYKRAKCNRLDGKCPHKNKTCARGWTGSSCSNECVEGRYGADCAKTCGNCRLGNTCSKNNGYCTSISGLPICSHGFFRIRCLEACGTGFWGADCKQSCGHCKDSVACSATNGSCPRALCDDGWRGQLCDISPTSACPDGKYGVMCASDCGHCYGEKACNKSSGECPSSNPNSPFCQPGWTGPKCLQNCSGMFYGTDCSEKCGHCYEKATCDPISGACAMQRGGKRCLAGWQGDLCDKECDQGTWGINCQACSKHCWDGPICNILTGKCQVSSNTPQPCKTGWVGSRCDQVCPSNKYGLMCSQKCGHCSYSVSHLTLCEKVNGTCLKMSDEPRCELGWHGPRCDQECDVGTYGGDCQKRCHCAYERGCDSQGFCPLAPDGTRPCKSGWVGEQCNHGCSLHWYGPGCKYKCAHCRDESWCNAVTGACPLVTGSSLCLDGWDGEKCDIADSPQKADFMIIYIIIPVLAVVIAAVIIIVILYRRRSLLKSNRRQMNGDDPQQLFNLLGRDDQNGIKSRAGCGKEQESVTEYANVSPVISSKVILVDDLLNYIGENKADGFRKEYQQLSSGLTASTNEANKPGNKSKNRFQGIVAYDHSRVVLNEVDDDPNSDYINACFLHGYSEQFRYIGSQGPTTQILADFWRMIWQFDTTKIIMLTNLVEDARRKCDQYWPVSGSKSYGNISVTILEEESFADFTIRTFNVCHTMLQLPSRIVKQFHFTVWPDHGVPKYPTALVHFREKVHTSNTTGTGPLLVHCSAGIGRTGTFIGLDYLIDQAKAEDQVDILQCVRNMRKQRVNMIQTDEQYAFLYEALAEAVLLSNLSIPSSRFEAKYSEMERLVDLNTGYNGLQEQFEMLATLSPTLSDTDCVGACLPENIDRNRYKDVLAVDNWRPYLATPVKDTTDYINAVFLPAYRDNRAFIATQMPLPFTTVDMWRLVYGQKAQCIIMLNELNLIEEESCVYWPYGGTTVGMYGPFRIEVVKVEHTDLFDIQTLTLVYTKMPDKEPLVIKQFVAKFWPDDLDAPDRPSDIVMLMEQVEHWQQQSGNGPIIVHCMNGAEKSGLYCAVSSIIERLKIDQEVNILQTVKQMRINRPQIIRNVVQYEFCFKAVVAYLESFQTYSNFK